MATLQSDTGGNTKNEAPADSALDHHGIAVRLRIVVAEDNPNEQLLLAAATHELGAEVEFEFVNDGLELIELLERRAAERAVPDLVILDLRMPRMDGHQVLDELAKHLQLWKLPVLVWTSSDDPAELERCWDEGAMWFENKPEDFSGYLALVRSIAARCSQAKEADDTTIDWASVLGDVLDL